MMYKETGNKQIDCPNCGDSNIGKSIHAGVNCDRCKTCGYMFNFNKK